MINISSITSSGKYNFAKINITGRKEQISALYSKDTSENGQLFKDDQWRLTPFKTKFTQEAKAGGTPSSRQVSSTY